MAFTPNSEVHLLSVPLENDYKNQIYFSNKTSQTDYFYSNRVFSFPKLTYQRKDNIIRVPKHIDEISNCNYVMYKNNNYTNKWFYAFITKKEYINDGTTHVYIETDVYQTWLFDVTLKDSFVEREHVMDDEIGAHTIPEGLETGEYICNKRTQAEYTGKEATGFSDSSLDKLSIVIGVTVEANGDSVPFSTYNNMYSGVKYYAFPCTEKGVGGATEFINSYPKEGRADAITCMFLAPLIITHADVLNDGKGGAVVYTNYPSYYYINEEGGDIEKVNNQIDITAYTLDGYFPRNKKLMCYPYRYLHVSNNNGSDVTYNYEKFKDENGITMPAFIIEGCLTPGCSIRMLPKNYNGVEYNHAEGINLGKLPILNWTSDAFTNWMTQNSVNVGLSLLSGTGQVVAGVGMAVASGGIGLAVGGSTALGGVNTIASTLSQIQQQWRVPPQAKGNTNCGDIITTSNKNDFHFYDMTIKKEYAEILDSYFDMFGYKINQVKIPNVNGRPYWNYVKTIDINIDGDIPSEDMQKLKDMYNHGVTLWKEGHLLGDYSLDNS